MRVTNSLFYNNSVNNYQRTMQELYKANEQMSGKKIQNSYEDSSVYVETMRLDYEVATLEQVKDSSSKAQAYANNTDQVLNQFTDSITQFKTLLLQSANESNSSTSLNAIANELNGLKEHMISLGNTSINGQYLFSGTAVTTKPFNDDGTYNGNDENMEAIIGAGVTLPYNITGNDLFLGTDSEYSRTLSTNVKLFNQLALNPSSGNPQEIYINENSTMRELAGDFDDDLTNDSNVAFYLSGRKSDGETFSERFSISQTSKMSDLVERIGKEYGNTSTNKVVNVSVNDNGQIEIKDLKKGNTLLEMNIFGAVNRDTVGNPGAELKTDIDELLAEPNVDIIEFSKSNFLNTNTASAISSKQDINKPGVFRVGAPMTFSDGTPAKTTTTLQSFMGDEVNQMEFSGTDNLNNTVLPFPPNDVFKIDNATTVDDLLTKIESIYGSSARLENGQIIVEGDETLDFAANQLKVNINALKGAGDGEVQSFSISTDATLGGDIDIGGVTIPILGGDSASDIAAKIVAQETALKADNGNIASVRADGNTIVVDYLESAGDVVTFAIANTTDATISANSIDVSAYEESGIAEIQSFNVKSNNSTGGSNIITVAGENITVNNTDSPTTIATNIKTALDLAAPLGSIDSVSTIGGEVTINYTLGSNVASDFLAITSLSGLNIGEVITEQNGGAVNNVDVFSTFDSMNYERRGFEKEGNLLSGNISQIVKSTGEYATNATKLSDVSSTTLKDKILELNFTDKDGNPSIATIDFKTLGSTFTINNGITHDILNSSGNKTSADDVTYQQLADVIGIAVSGTTYDSVYDSTKYSNEYEENFVNAQNSVEVGLNSKGQLEILDKQNSESPIEFSMFDSNADEALKASSLTFMANDAIKVEDPKIDFFSDLNGMIESVREGYFSVDGDSDDPRNVGIQNSISRIDHFMEHVAKEHTKIGSYSNALTKANERSELLSINVQTVRSEVIDVDIAEAYMKFNQLSNSYQAMLSTVAKINSMSLLNYM